MLATYPVYLYGIRVKFVYKGHRVKFKVTEAKQVDNPRNVKLPSATTQVLQNTEPRNLRVAWSFRI